MTRARSRPASWRSIARRVLRQGRLRARRHRRATALPVDVVAALEAAPVKAVPRYPEAPRPASDVCREADAYLAAEVPIAPGLSAAIDELSWRRDPFAGRGGIASLLFHALHHVEVLVQAWEASARAAYLERARRIASRWIDECLDAGDEHLWDDHGTALRAITLCRLWLACRAHEGEGSRFSRSLLTAIAAHGDVLADERFHRADHNHGIVQAYALLAVGFTLPALPEARAWVARGRAWLEGHMARDVSGEGVHREHSPAYHFFALRHFMDAWTLARAHGEELSSAFIGRLEAMIAAGPELLKPDGAPAALGDTCRTSPLMIEPRDLDAWARSADGLLHVVTAGTRGRWDPWTSRLLGGAGYAILRSGRGAGEPAEHERYVIARTATFRTAHIHRDVGSFELYAYGTDLVVDAGGPYAYGHRIRMELMRTAAHNTVVVDGADQAIGEAQILRWTVGDAADTLDLVHRLYRGVRHRRVLALIRTGYLLVVDRLEAAEAHDYAQVFHLHPALEVAVHDRSIVTTRHDGRATLRIVPLSTDDLGVALERGGPSADRGWACVRDGEVVPAWVVRYQRRARTATFLTLLIADRPGERRDVAAAVEGIPFTEDCRVSVRGPDVAQEILIPAAAAPTESAR